MNRLETVLFLIMAVMVLIATYYFFQPSWFFCFIILFTLNALFNGQKYRNKSYFLINFILAGLFLPISIYYSYSGYMAYSGIIFGLIFLSALYYEYTRREKDEKRPWRNNGENELNRKIINH